MTYCSNCGKATDKTDKYCPYCGIKNSEKKSFTENLNEEIKKFTADKEPFTAAVLSIFFPGLGQIYNGEFKKGFFIQLSYILSLILSAVFLIAYLLPIAIIIISVYDAHTKAEKMKQKTEPSKNPTLKEVILFLLAPIFLIGGLIILAIVITLLAVILTVFAAIIAILFSII